MAYQEQQRQQRHKARLGCLIRYQFRRPVEITKIAKKAVSEASDIREDKVALLKNMVDSGQYEVSGDDFASKLLE